MSDTAMNNKAAMSNKQAKETEHKTKKISVLQLIREDIACVFQRDPAARTRLEIITTYPGVHAILLYRFANRYALYTAVLKNHPPCTPIKIRINRGTHMDMLDFEGEALYFDEPLSAEAQLCIDQAAENYEKDQAEKPLMRAYFLEPEHPVIMVALYRFFYYQHQLADALIVAKRILNIFAKRLNLPKDWQELKEEHLLKPAADSMALVRFYLWTLKGAGYLELRLGEHDSGMTRLEKVLEVDEKNHFGAEVLLDVANEVVNNIYKLRRA